MNRTSSALWLLLISTSLVSPIFSEDNALIKTTSDPTAETEAVAPANPESDELSQAKEAMKSEMGEMAEEKNKQAVPHRKEGKKSRAEAFVAGPEWEFDGFVSGGQDQSIKSMFTVNDLLYLNVGTDQGFTSGDRMGVYRRGERIRDSQTNRVLGFEVRKVAIAEITERISDQTSSARILKVYEPAELGDLVRREE